MGRISLDSPAYVLRRGRVDCRSTSTSTAFDRAVGILFNLFIDNLVFILPLLGFRARGLEVEELCLYAATIFRFFRFVDY
jgi:hypothetical protein